MKHQCYDVTKPIKLHCDASAREVGACLMHVVNGEEKPVAYASRTLSVAEQNYSHIEVEALAIIFGVKHFNQYLYGREFNLVTDHRPLCKLFSHADGVRSLAAACMQQWAIILSAYSYKIEYIPGPANQCADCLSRLPVQCYVIHPAEEGNAVHAMHTITSPVTATEIANHTTKDKILSQEFMYVQFLANPNARKHRPLSSEERGAYIARWVCAMGETSNYPQKTATATIGRITFWSYWNLSNEILGKKFYLVALLRC